MHGRRFIVEAGRSDHKAANKCVPVACDPSRPGLECVLVNASVYSWSHGVSVVWDHRF